MPRPQSGLPVFMDRHGDLLRQMVRTGMTSWQARTRLHLLFPHEPAELIDRAVDALGPGFASSPALDLDPDLALAGVWYAWSRHHRVLPSPEEAALVLDDRVFRDLTALLHAGGADENTTARVLGCVGAAVSWSRSAPVLELSATDYDRAVASAASTALPPALRGIWPLPRPLVEQSLGCADFTYVLTSTAPHPRPPASDEVEDDSAQEIDAWASLARTGGASTGREGIGLAPSALNVPGADESVWEELYEEIVATLQALPWNDFLVVEYESEDAGDLAPSSWANPQPVGISCGIVSEDQLPPHEWEFDPEYFADSAWDPPQNWDEPWSAGPVPAPEAARLLLEGLRYGRGCTDPYRYHWGTGSYATGDPAEGTSAIMDFSLHHR